MKSNQIEIVENNQIKDHKIFKFDKDFVDCQILKFLQSSYFLYLTCGLIFCVSIYLRSILDIGTDTAVYMNVGKKLAQGKKYYYDIFEGNFPLSMYVYSLQFKLSEIVKINPIILSEIFVNLFGLLSIFWSTKILHKSTHFNNKIEFNLIVISYFLGFFLRPYGVFIGEFGTKTSFLLMVLIPYFSYCLVDKNNLNIRDQIKCGILMGLIPCLKINYLIFVLLLEFYFFLQIKKIRFLVGLDKLVALAICIIYLVYIFLFDREYLQLLIPLWNLTYAVYLNSKLFLSNFYSGFSYFAFPYLCILLIFTHIKFQQNDVLFVLLFIAGNIVVGSENIFTNDQMACYCAVSTICFLRFIYIIVKSQKILFSENKFFIGALFFVPFFEDSIIRNGVFSIFGVINVWWLMMPASIFIIYSKLKLSLRQKYIFLIKIFLFLAFCFAVFYVYALTYSDKEIWRSNFLNLALFFSFYFIFEKKFFSKRSEKFSKFSSFIILASCFCFFHDYSVSFSDVFSDNAFDKNYRKVKDFKAFYYKTVAPNVNDYELDFYQTHQLALPIALYFNKELPQKIVANQNSYGLFLQLPSQSEVKFEESLELSKNHGYLFDDIISMLKNPKTKLVFIDNFKYNFDKDNLCSIGYVEFLSRVPEFKRLFFKNFRYENRIILSKKNVASDSLFDRIFFQENNSQNKLSKANDITYNIEVYVRR